VELAKRQGGHVVGLAFAIELGFLNGRARLPRELDVYSVLRY
jgi:adenine/guanine phosphoribosyltransferase-like PRPP-binding protein